MKWVLQLFILCPITALLLNIICLILFLLLFRLVSVPVSVACYLGHHQGINLKCEDSQELPRMLYRLRFKGRYSSEWTQRSHPSSLLFLWRVCARCTLEEPPLNGLSWTDVEETSRQRSDHQCHSAEEDPPMYGVSLWISYVTRVLWHRKIFLCGT